MTRMGLGLGALRFAGSRTCIGIGCLAVAGSAAAQVAAPTESDFFEKASGKWCRLDIHAPATLEIVIPDDPDDVMTATLSSPSLTVETEASFASFSVEDRRVIVAFEGSSANRRHADGSVFVADFVREYVFDLSLSQFNSRTPGGRLTFYGRCQDEEAGEEMGGEPDKIPGEKKDDAAAPMFNGLPAHILLPPLPSPQSPTSQADRA
ncbi:MAG: hypothetical protein O7C63_04760 [Alphaproteobacteria bacterium]|nr:hypothetical protein [Alphaproteobacteria bacterium]MCZ6764229.1 hypothetical protein [Alphaproteobacteria bacterium]